jgi:hypothetical protein
MMKKNDFADLTFLIPLRLDSLYRAENVLMVVRSLQKYNTKIVVCEASERQYLGKGSPFSRINSLTYLYEKDYDPVFHRTYYINRMLRHVDTKFLAVWDADVIVYPSSIKESMLRLRNGDADVSFPYDGRFLGMDQILRSYYLEHPQIATLHKIEAFCSQLYAPFGKDTKHPGGGFIIEREKYLYAGGENERFYGWGPEDMERLANWRNLGYEIHRSHGPMFHLYHPRDMNGKYRSRLQSKLCEKLCSDTLRSNRIEAERLRSYRSFLHSNINYNNIGEIV